MNLSEYVKYDGIGLAELLARKEVSAGELAVLARQANIAVNPSINAVIELFDDVIDDPLSDGMNPDGPFRGVPLLYKDLGSRLRGRKQEAGYAWRSSDVADHDDPIVVNLRSSGINIIGRTTCPEDGITLVTESIKFGITRNPWNTDFSPGGSSGGSAAAVAAGIVPLASASDGGGSIRIPAGWTGLVGHKPSRGLLPLTTMTNEYGNPTGVEGVVTKTVRDSALAYDLMRAQIPGWSYMPLKEPERLFLDCVVAPEKRSFRIALDLGAHGFDDACAPEIADTMRDVARTLESLGHHVEEIDGSTICDWSSLFDGYRALSWIIPIGVWLEYTADKFGVELSPENTSPIAMAHIEAAKKYSFMDIYNAKYSNAVTTRQWAEFFGRYDMVLTPTTPIRCPEVESGYSPASEDSLAEWLDRVFASARYTLPSNECGMPSISVPAGVDRNGLPFGALLTGRWAEDGNLFQVAAELEHANPDAFDQRPPVHASTVGASD